MKLRSHVFAVLALAIFSLPAAAQARGLGSTRSTSNAPVRYGSFERTKLFTQARRRSSEDEMRLGAADRRALLTTGKSIHKKKPERRYFHR
jgi:hypothetical protein